MKRRALKRLAPSDLIDLKIDYAFKQLFGSERNKSITVVFLNAILKRTGRDTIKEISFRNIEINGEYVGDKQSRLDLLVKTQDNERVNVEIQFSNKYDMVKRSIYYWSQIFGDQLGKGMGYNELNTTITINILNFNQFEDTQLFHTTYHLYEDTERYKLDDVLEIHFIEIPKLLSQWRAERLDPFNDILARWLLLLGIVDHRKGKVYDDIYEELEEIAMRDEHLMDAFSIWEELSSRPEDLLAYRSRLKQVMDDEAMVREAQLREEAALKRGREEGKKETRWDVAKNLLEMNMEIEAISKATGLAPEVIRQLEENAD